MLVAGRFLVLVDMQKTTTTKISSLLTVLRSLQVHSGFLGAYDSVRTRIISLIRLAIGYV